MFLFLVQMRVRITTNLHLVVFNFDDPPVSGTGKNTIFKPFNKLSKDELKDCWVSGPIVDVCTYPGRTGQAVNQVIVAMPDDNQTYKRVAQDLANTVEKPFIVSDLVLPEPQIYHNVGGPRVQAAGDPSFTRRFMEVYLNSDFFEPRYFE